MLEPSDFEAMRPSGARAAAAQSGDADDEQEYSRAQWELAELGLPDDGYDYTQHLRTLGDGMVNSFAVLCTSLRCARTLAFVLLLCACVCVSSEFGVFVACLRALRAVWRAFVAQSTTHTLVLGTLLLLGLNFEKKPMLVL